jgi:hypothetical protein
MKLHEPFKVAPKSRKKGAFSIKGVFDLDNGFIGVSSLIFATSCSNSVIITCKVSSEIPIKKQ